MKSRLQLSSPFTKSILTLITGNAIAFIIPIAVYPVLSRLFTPEDYALFGLYFGLYSFLEIGSVGRYDFAVVMPEEEDDARNLAAGGFIISLFYAATVLLLVTFLNRWIAALLNNPGLAPWLYCLPVGLLAVSISKLCNSWLIRKKAFRASSVNKASQKLAETSGQLLFGILKVGSGLIIGDISGRIFNAGVSYFQAKRYEFKRRRISKQGILTNLKRYVEFPKYGVFPSMLNALGGMMPVFVISSYYTSTVSGSFNFSRILLSVPFALISAGISQVLMQQVSEKKNKNQPIYRELLVLGGRLSILSLVGIVVIVFAGPELFEFVFGSKWRQSGEFTTILIFSYTVSFVVSPFSILLSILGKIRIAGLWQTCYFLLISTLWLFNDLSIERLLMVLVGIDLLSYMAYGLIIYNVVKGYDERLMEGTP